VNTVQLGRIAPVDPLAPRVPERTIGVTIAGQQSTVAPRGPAGAPPMEQPGSGFDAVQPQEQVDLPPNQPGARAAAVASVAAPAYPPGLPRGLEAGQVRCRVCGQAVATDRRFCRCGASLVPTVTKASSSVALHRLPWYRRLGDLFGGGRDFRRSMRSANRGLRATYNVGLSARTHLVRATMLLGTVGVGLSQFGPWGGDLRGQLYSQVDRLRPHSYTDVPIDQAATDPITRALPGFDVKFAVDGDPGRAWAAPWRQGTSSGQPCHQDGGAPALVVTFRQPASLNRVTMLPGLSESNDQRFRQARPRQVDLLFSDGACTVFPLQDDPTAQHIDVKATNVTSVRVVIVDAYPPRDATGPPLVSISEISFQRQR
jgi:hypothetical protein